MDARALSALTGGAPANVRGTRLITLERVALAVLTAGTLASLFFWVHPWYVPSNDGSMYIRTARSLVDGEGYSMLGIPFRIRPPGFSVLIAPILALRGTDFFALNLLVSASGAVGVVLVFLYFRERLGWPLAWLTAAAIWLNPGYQSFCNQPLSDVPGTALFFGCLLLERRTGRSHGFVGNVLLGACIALAAYVRSVTILLVPAIFASRLLARALAKEPESSWRMVARGLAAVALGALLIQGPWKVRNALVDAPIPADQTLLHSYGSGMWHVDPGDPRSPRLSLTTVLGRFPKQAKKTSAVLGSRLGGTDRGPAEDAISLFFVGCALVLLVRHRRSVDFFLFATLGIVAFYFGFASRLLIPVYLLVLPAAVEVVRDVVAFVSKRGVAAVVTGVLLAALIAIDLDPRRDWGDIQNGHRFYRDVARAFEVELGHDARIASHRGWHYAVFLDRPVYSLEFAVKRAQRPDAVEDVLDAYDLNTVILSPALEKDRQILPYFQRRYGEKRGNALVYRVRE